MRRIRPGTTVALFFAPRGVTGNLRDTATRKLGSYFYPRHMTNGCTGAALRFSARLFDVIKPRSLYGGKYSGVERRTLLVDGRLRPQWRKVKVPAHAEEVLEATQCL